MAYHSRLHVYNTVIATGLMPLFYTDNVDTGKRIVDACVGGGAKAIEMTNRGDFAIEVFGQLRRYTAETYPDVIFGVGSIVEAPTAALYIASGADFVVAPNLNPEVSRLCNRRKIPYIPGCSSASEIGLAEELGSEIVKLFPADTLGAGFVKAILGPMPRTNLMITGGVDVTEENIRMWFEAGAACVGIASNLIRKDDVATGNFDMIQKRCEQVLGWIKTYKKEA